MSQVFTPEQVEALNRWQREGMFHPYTCGGDRQDAAHLDGEGVLVATTEGWVCPYCPYTQNWAHGVMSVSNAPTSAPVGVEWSTQLMNKLYEMMKTISDPI